ncbi:beta-L-arabinofuranosidase domain-containing protein, partial [Streptomonospora algeriensis]
LYLACGAVDAAVETGDDGLLEAVAAQYDRTLARRTYITGGMGAHHAGEAFGDDFVLPADRTYSETCAGVASAMLAWRLLLATGEPRYADALERVLYNVVATSVADDGRSFFYANTLHQRVPTEPVAPDRELLRFSGGPRAPWFEVSCCLPNAARLLASLGAYLATADLGGLQLHQYADAEVRTRLG